MVAVIVLRAGLPFRIRLYEKTAEIGDGCVNLIRLGLPPGGNRGVQRIGRLEMAELDRRRPARRQIDLDAIGPEYIRERRRLGDIGRGQAVGLCVDIVEDGAVDADRGIGPGIVGVAGVPEVGELPPVPDRLPGIAALDGAIEIVPVVEQAQLELGGRRNVERVDRLAALDALPTARVACQGRRCGPCDGDRRTGHISHDPRGGRGTATRLCRDGR